MSGLAARCGSGFAGFGSALAGFGSALAAFGSALAGFGSGPAGFGSALAGIESGSGNGGRAVFVVFRAIESGAFRARLADDVAAALADGSKAGMSSMRGMRSGSGPSRGSRSRLGEGGLALDASRGIGEAEDVVGRTGGRNWS